MLQGSPNILRIRQFVISGIFLATAACASDAKSNDHAANQSENQAGFDHARGGSTAGQAEASLSEAKASSANDAAANHGVDPQFAKEVNDEVTIGRGIASRLLGVYGYYKTSNGELERYVNLVGLSLALQSGRPELVYHFAILDTNEINAFATPGGYVFVTRGLLKQMKGEDELACVLGHELAHVNLKHMYKQLSAKRDLSNGEILARILSHGGADVGGALGQLVSKGMKILTEDGYGKEKEFEADAVGITYAAASGYNPTALAHLVARIDKSKVRIGKTHPHGRERLNALNQALKTNGLTSESNKSPAVLEKRFAVVSSNL